VFEYDEVETLDGYLGRTLSAEEEIRFCLYRVYLWLILVTERRSDPGVWR